MKRLVGISTLLVLAFACAHGGAVGVGTLSSPASPAPSSPRTPASPHPSLTVQPRSISLAVWFNSGETLFPARRTVPATQAVGTAALKALLAGPTGAEIAGGVGTQLPAGTRLRGLSIANGLATVALSSEFGAGGVVGKTFTTATCGTGCRGTYSAKVRYHVGRTQPGTIMVFEASAQDGRPIHVQRVPVTLTA